MYWRGSIDVAGGVVVIEVVRQAAVALIGRVIGVGVIGIVADRVGRPVHVGAGIGDVEIGDLALDRQRGLRELVLAISRCGSAATLRSPSPVGSEDAVEPLLLSGT